MKNVLNQIVEKIKTHVLCSVHPPENRTIHEIMLENIVQPNRLRNNLKLRRKAAHFMSDN